MRVSKKKLKQLKRILWAIKGFCGSTGLTLIVANYMWLGIAVALLGAFADMTFDYFFKEDTNDTAEGFSGGGSQ